MDFARSALDGQLQRGNFQRSTVPADGALREMAVDGDDWTERYGNVTVRLAHIGGRGGRVLPDIPRQAWRRAARFVGLLGTEATLHLLDERAERALLAGRVGSACNWRNLMAAVHAMSDDEREDRERDH